MDLQMRGKVALVTASTAGIGLAIAQSLRREGALVILNGRTQERVDAALRSVSAISAPPECPAPQGIALDLATAEGARALHARYPEVDVLVNNLGIYEAKPAVELRDSDWQRMFDVNVVSGARLAQLYLPAMLRKNWGRVLFIASESGVNIPSEMLHYGVSKAAQIALSRGLAETTLGTGVTVNAILPGPTLSEGVERFLAEMPQLKGGGDPLAMQNEFIRASRPTSLLQRFATAEEVASLVAYVASPLASATNGASLRVEGGLLRHFG